jgi:hypothetical protein
MDFSQAGKRTCVPCTVVFIEMSPQPSPPAEKLPGTVIFPYKWLITKKEREEENSPNHSSPKSYIQQRKMK